MRKLFLNNDVLSKTIIFVFIMAFLSFCRFTSSPPTLYAADKQFLDKSCPEYGILIQTAGNIPASEAMAPDIGKWVRWSGKVVAVEETLWGADVTVTCTESSTEGAITLSFDSKPALLPGKQINFTGQVESFPESGGIALKSAELIQSFQKEPVSASMTSSGKSTTTINPTVPSLSVPPPRVTEDADAHRNVLNDVSAKVRSYFGFVQSREVDRAIMLYATVKRPNIKRNVIEAVAKDTEYYRIDRIEPVKLGPLDSRVAVYVWHKRIKGSEEYWEIYMDFVNEQGEWRIVSTPGKRIR